MNGNGHEEKPTRKSRLDRIEAAMELMVADHQEFRQEFKILLKTQVVMADAQEKLAAAQRESEKKIAELAEVQKKLAERQDRTSIELRELSKKTDERIAAMTSAIGELIRRMPLPPESGAPGVQ